MIEKSLRSVELLLNRIFYRKKINEKKIERPLNVINENMS